MKADHPLIAGLSIALLLGSGMLQAAPPEDRQHPQGHDGGQHVQQSHGQPQDQGRPQGPDQGHQPQMQQQANRGNGRPPQDFNQVHQAFRDHRQQIGRGPDLPPNVRIQQGRPLPHGYGKRLDARALQGLPRYQGYEWRRVGSDIVLVTVATGIVYTILQGVLN
jgi:Ni/Co efflux regulator RcnB